LIAAILEITPEQIREALRETILEQIREALREIIPEQIREALQEIIPEQIREVLQEIHAKYVLLEVLEITIQYEAITVQTEEHWQSQSEATLPELQDQTVVLQTEVLLHEAPIVHSEKLPIADNEVHEVETNI
jgi:hypothetical protein